MSFMNTDNFGALSALLIRTIFFLSEFHCCRNLLNFSVSQGNRAIVVDEPGVTRDRLYGRSYWGDQEFMVIDTGGVITLSKSQAGVMEELAVTTTVGMDGIPLATREAAIARMPSMIEKQAVAAVEEATVILFIVDGQAGSGNYLKF